MDLRMQNLQTPVVVIKTVFKGNPRYVKAEATSECVLITNSWIEANDYVEAQIKELKEALSRPMIFSRYDEYAGRGTLLEHPYHIHRWVTYNTGTLESVKTTKYDIIRIRFEDIDILKFYENIQKSYPIEKPKMANDFKEY